MITKRNLPELFVVFILLLFVLLKIPALHLPYFWDELGVYSRAGLYLHDNGLGLLPKDLPPELSRGHPLLFAFIQAIGYNIFGDGVVGGHITALIISLILLWSVYFITSKYFSKYTALLAVMILIIQPLFFAQSVDNNIIDQLRKNNSCGYHFFGADLLYCCQIKKGKNYFSF